MNSFPAPVKVGPGATRWRLSDLLKWETASFGGDDPTPASSDERFLRDVEVAARYDVSRVTPWRWARQSADTAA